MNMPSSIMALISGESCRIAAVVGMTLGPIAGAAAEAIILELPVDCEVGRTCFIQNYVDADPSSVAKDYAGGTLTYDGHTGTDFRMPSRSQSKVEVLAAASGTVTRVRDKVPDGSFLELGDDVVRGLECGNGVVIEHAYAWETQYCHLAKDSVRVKPGDRIRIGDVLGKVGLSGKTEFLHLHFMVRHEGKIVDPFAYDAALGDASRKSLWAAALDAQLAYRDRTVLNAGFAGHQITMDLVEEGKVEDEQLTANVPALVAYVRTIGLKAGDAQLLVMRDPNGQIIAENRVTLSRDKAQAMLFVGKRKAQEGWRKGVYTASYVVEHESHIVLRMSFSLVLSD
jgi:murein DD-endopeptidase MepM/ murein hydrolase activator NlpD